MSDYEDYEDEPMAELKASEEGIQIQVSGYEMDRIATAAAREVANHLSKRLDDIAREMIEAALDDAWHARIQAHAEAAIEEYLTKPRPRTNQWGERINGQQDMTISEMVPEAVKKWLEQPVNYKGERADPYNRKDCSSRVDWIITTQVASELTDATAQAADQVTKEARKVVANHVARFVSEQMVPAIEAPVVKS